MVAVLVERRTLNRRLRLLIRVVMVVQEAAVVATVPAAKAPADGINKAGAVAVAADTAKVSTKTCLHIV